MKPTGTGGRRVHGPAKSAEGYVVRTYNFGEADRIVVLVTASDGRIEGMAKGARRWKGGYGAALEPLTYVRASYRDRPGRDLVRFERVEILRSSFDVIATPEALDTFSHVAELLQTVAVPGEPHERLIRLVGALLEAARGLAGREAGRAGYGPSLELLRLYFDVWVARLGGFWPDLSSCASCDQAISGPCRVGTHADGALCPDCARRGDVQSLPLGVESLGLLRRFAAIAPAELREEPSKRCIKELNVLMLALLSTHLDKRLRTLSTHPRRSGRLG